MATYRVQMGFPMDSALARDVVTVNPHFEGDNPQALGDALLNNLKGNATLGATIPVTIKVYDARKAPPSYPLYTVSNGTGFVNSSGPREVALCLSYYATFNRPSFRGRLYLPLTFFGGALGIRPTSTQRANALAFKDVFGKNLPSGHWWSVWSVKQQSSAQVNSVWVDDEWDTIRSRGLRATARSTGTLP